MLLADAAQAEAKVHALGLGWNMVGTPLPQHSLVIWFFADWHEANQPHTFGIELVDEDGAGVVPGGGVGPDEQPMAMAGEFEVGRPAGLVKGTELVQPLAVTVPHGMPLDAGRYEYRLSVNEVTMATASFTVLKPQ